ncbi:MAG TPA: alpha/beta fold hydrolase [Pseudonocardiaceae bacterium]|jgi:pimeloyl-ACP methyl ester carboxylesterase|nr:alpha/beta fold hydrolase [Pseudonocardiaceae bacterium]
MTLAHQVTGAGPAVLLLHSSACDRRMWGAQVPGLVRSGHRVVTADFPGYGDTPPVAHPADSENVLELLDELGIESAVLIGASYGGRIAHQVAAAHPDRVRGLVLLCAGMLGLEPSPGLIELDEREQALLAAGELDKAAELNAQSWLGPEADDAAHALLREMRTRSYTLQRKFDMVPDAPQPGVESTEVDLAAIAAPTLVVSGTHDFEDFQRIADLLAEGIRDAKHVVLSWAGHLPNMERPAEITALLVDFLAELN